MTTITQRREAMEAEITALRGSLTAREAELVERNARIATLEAELSTPQGELAEALDMLAAAQERVDQLDAKLADVDARAATKAAELLGAVGVPPATVTPAGNLTSQVTPDSGADVLAQYEVLRKSEPAKAHSFYLEHKDAICAAMRRAVK